MKATLTYPISIESTGPGLTPPNPAIVVSNEAQIIKILRIVFGIFAAIYMIFLLIDAIIIHRAKITRDSVHSSPHLLVFALLVAVTFFTSWF